jgi:predicted RNA-binding Zn-ribbon protein involved in translation (DUF1610 family)
MSSRFQGRLREAYVAMSERVLHLMQHEASETTKVGGVRQSLEDALLQAREWVMTLKELSYEEADALADALRREVDELSQTLVAAEEEFEDWVETDLLFAEHRAVECMLLAADPTTRDLMRLKEKWAEQMAQLLRVGDAVEAGAYECVRCGDVLHVHEAEAVLPPCPSCGGELYRRIRSAVM